MKLKSIGIIGIGKLGESLFDMLSHLRKLSFVLIRNKKRIQEIKEKYFRSSNETTRIIQNINEILDSFDCIFITVNDGSIKSVVEDLIKTKLDFRNKFIIHCSGIQDPNILSPLADRGAITVAAHPYQTFFQPSKKNFQGIYWGIESSFDIQIIEPFLNLLKSFKSNYHFLEFSSKDKKTLYHLSAVLASNFTSLILFKANEILNKSGIDNIDILKPIIITTIKNFFESEDSKFPLTGPAIRGDITTIKEHLKAIESNKQFFDFYVNITKHIALTAHQHKIIKKKDFNQILTLFNEESVK
ncbi:MAG: DUF2520 domain-containing protein [Candidatus Kapabacteria bacterium]|nr:DUF2520 domain-containing protein [Candidatus Kapabacteria bacterium]